MTRRGGAKPVAGRRCRGIVAGACVAIAALAGRPSAAPAAPASWDVAVGFAGRFRAGSWTPLVVTAPGAGGGAAGDRLTVWVEDPDGALVRSPPAALEPDGAGRLAARFSVRSGRPAGRLFVGSDAATRSACRLPPAIPSTHRILLVVGDLPAARRAARIVRHADAPPLEVVPLGADSAVGAAARDYDSADVIVVCGGAVAGVADAVLRGIDAWVHRGGRLVLAAGGSAADLQAAGGPAARWLPGAVDRLVPLRRVGAIETFARTAGLADRATPGLRVPVLANRAAVPGTVDVFEGAAATDLPLVVRRAHGLGTVTWAALDLDAEPFRSWSGTDELLARLLGGGQRDVDATRAATADSGPADLAGQLRVALEDFGREPGWNGRGPVPFAIVLGIGLAYVLCLYPLEWWLVSRGRGSAADRPALAWVTAPRLIAGFTAAAWAVAGRWRPPAAVAARAAEVIDVDAASGAIRGTAWAAVWRHDNARVDVQVRPPDGPAAAAVSWCADAGTGFGAIDATMPHPQLAVADYGYDGALDALAGVPVAAASDRLFEAEWTGACGTDVVASTLALDAQGALRGSVSHRLPFALDDCHLAHGGWLYDIGRLAADTPFDPQAGRGPRSLAGALTRRATTGERDVVARWDTADTALERILEIAGFHAAAGGVGYTRLEPGRLGRLDLSAVLAVDRAVLWGTAAAVPPEWTTAWRLPDEPPGVTRLYRIVIPLATAPER
jgi:hypothetical protein